MTPDIQDGTEKMKAEPHVLPIVPTPPGLDPGIEPMVRLLNEHGVQTVESCEGGEGHAYHLPTVTFMGGYAEGFRALAVALDHGFKVWELRRVYRMEVKGCTGEIHGPWWELVFVPTKGQWSTSSSLVVPQL